MSVTNKKTARRGAGCSPRGPRPDTAAAKLSDELKKLRVDMMRLDNAVEQADEEETWEEALSAVGLLHASVDALMHRIYALWAAAYEDGEG